MLPGLDALPLRREQRRQAARAGLIGTPSFRNRLRNGNFVLNQRAVSGTVTLAAGVYGHDGWKAGAGGCTYTFATSGNSTVITISAGSLLQIVEAALVEGGVYSLSHQGTAQARIAVNGASTSGSYANAPMQSASAAANQTITAEFSTGTLDRVQLEPGTIFNAFERRPLSIEAAICKWHYNGGVPIYLAGMAGTGITIGMKTSIPTMRANPTVTVASDTSVGAIGSRSFSAGQNFAFVSTAGNAAAGFIIDVALNLSAEL